ATGRVVGINEGADSKLGAGDTGDDFIPERKRRHRATEALKVIGHLRFPEEEAALGVERHEVRIRGRKEEPAAQHASTTIHFGRIIGIDHLATTLILPNDAPAASVKRKDAAQHTGRVHHAIHDEWSGLKRPATWYLERPPRLQPAHVLRHDVLEGR